MTNYIVTSWIILVVTALVVVLGNVFEKKNHLITKFLKMEVKNFNIVFGGAGIVISIINYIAMEFFGSWKTMLIIVAIFVAIVYGLMFYFKKNKEKS